MYLIIVIVMKVEWTHIVYFELTSIHVIRTLVASNYKVITKNRP